MRGREGEIKDYITHHIYYKVWLNCRKPPQDVLINVLTCLADLDTLNNAPECNNICAAYALNPTLHIALIK